MSGGKKVKKSILLTVDASVWKRFKAKAAIRDEKIGVLVKGWISQYLKKSDS